MALENKTQPPQKTLSLSDTQARDHFIGVALREIISDQIANSKWNADMAATWAVRYANAVMAVRATDTTPLKTVVSKGTTSPQVPPASNDETASDEKPAKSIAEIIGDASELAEVK